MKQIKIENYTNVPINVSVTEFDDEFRVIIEDAKREVKPIILDNNPLSIACYMEEHPDVELDTHTKDYGHKDLIDKDYKKGCLNDYYLDGIFQFTCGKKKDSNGDLFLCPKCDKFIKEKSKGTGGKE